MYDYLFRAFQKHREQIDNIKTKPNKKIRLQLGIKNPNVQMKNKLQNMKGIHRKFLEQENEFVLGLDNKKIMSKLLSITNRNNVNLITHKLRLLK